MKSLSRHPETERSGVSAILIAIMLFTLIVAAGMTVDVAYMQLIRTELRAATDAAATAGAEALTRDGKEAAINAAISYARNNKVAGRPFLIDRNDIEVGRISPGESGKYVFELNDVKPNAVRVNGRMADDAASKPVRLFFAGNLGHSDFAPSHLATAGSDNVEICLALDRSGSMAWEMSSRSYVWPPNNPYLIPFRIPQLANHYSPPHPSDSRWASLKRAVRTFMDEANRSTAPTRVGLVTWAENLTHRRPIHDEYMAGTLDFPLPIPTERDLTTNTTGVLAGMDRIATAPLLGGTDMAAGLDLAVQELTSSRSLPHADKVIILLSDGRPNKGRSRESAAIDARDRGIVVHCVDLLGASPTDLQLIASITGGEYFEAMNDAELQSAFRALAQLLPVALVE